MKGGRKTVIAGTFHFTFTCRWDFIFFILAALKPTETKKKKNAENGFLTLVVAYLRRAVSEYYCGYPIPQIFWCSCRTSPSILFWLLSAERLRCSTFFFPTVLGAQYSFWSQECRMPGVKNISPFIKHFILNLAFNRFVATARSRDPCFLQASVWQRWLSFNTRLSPLRRQGGEELRLRRCNMRNLC